MASASAWTTLVWMAWIRTSWSEFAPARSRAPSADRKAWPAARPNTRAARTARPPRSLSRPGVPERPARTDVVTVVQGPERFSVGSGAGAGAGTPAPAAEPGAVWRCRPGGAGAAAAPRGGAPAVAAGVGIVTTCLQGGGCGQGVPDPQLRELPETTPRAPVCLGGWGWATVGPHSRGIPPGRGLEPAEVSGVVVGTCRSCRHRRHGKGADVEHPACGRGPELLG